MDAWTLLTAIAAGTAETLDTAEEPREVVTAHLDELVVLSTRHRMLPALAAFLHRSGLAAVVPPSVRVTAEAALAWNTVQASLFTREAIAVRDAVAAAGVPVVFNKGIVCQSELYGRDGTRTFSDIDLMIRAQDADGLRDALRGRGFHAGVTPDPTTGTLVPLPREKALIYALYPDHLPHFHRLDRHHGVLLPVIVDVSLSLTWWGSDWQVPLERALESARQVPVTDEESLPALEPALRFLFLVLHLFREAWFERTIRENVLRLPQFGDIARSWRSLAPADRARVTELLGEHELHPPVAWVVHHVDRVLGTDIAESLPLADFRDRSWLHSAGAQDGGYLAWDGDMTARLRAGAAPVLTPVREPPFAAAAKAR